MGRSQLSYKIDIAISDLFDVMTSDGFIVNQREIILNNVV